MNKKLTIIIALQALLIVTLFWVLVFYGRDEYEAYRAGQEEEIESPSRVSEKAGINIVSLPPATQQNSGITTAKVSAAQFQGTIKSYGNVVSIDSLTEAKARALSLKTDIALARAASTSNMQQYQRLKTLNADDKNVSDRAVQEALAAVSADNAKITASESQLKNLQTSMKLQWGEVLTKLAFEDKLAPHLANLLERKNVLIQVSLPLSISAPKTGSSIHVTPLNESVAPIKAVYVSPATTSDSSSFGKTFYYSAPAELLRIGMRVNVELDPNAGDSTNGIIIPSNAVVWYAGKPWAYFKQGKDQFVRKPIAADTEVATGWFNQGIDANSEVVVSGAQLLLSEEFKYQIKNENED
ncbi:MAG: efflux RND transporter periplasmic adaptor subunit [Methylotenera sp.]